MFRTMPQVKQDRSKRYHIVGPDIDLDMLRVLTPGDKVLTEMNGARLFSTSNVPAIADDHPWTVVANEPGTSLHCPTLPTVTT
jgi:hypothetical protein